MSGTAWRSHGRRSHGRRSPDRFGAGADLARSEGGGIDAVITAVIARVKGGGDVVEAFEEQYGARFATPRVTADRVARVLAVHAGHQESGAEVRRTARLLTVACRLAQRLGCEVSSCLEAVAEEYRRERRAAAQRAQAFAVPESTIRLLTALPLVTVALGELMGSRPVVFLFGTPRGWCALAAGALWYLFGLLWTQNMLRSFSKESERGRDLPVALAMLRAALGQGASIPDALTAVGWVLAEEPEEGRGAGDALGGALLAAGRALRRGASWREAWLAAVPPSASTRSSEEAALIRDCLGEAWMHGAVPTRSLALAEERYERDASARAEAEAARLSVRLLAPTGLCFLPAFVLVGVVPAIAAFTM